ncbi:hypothetical protein, conserved [Eimeria acervulina]|uniref:Uncharacterized protein n=1 Tax=Eimeria acervulina TaxID=5801 RepID=U6GL62_EIMAC|nr:hypothetical protein, conserved [Eimeria acervulina]CDI80915.1 hypothetical protein, conserved [Eimeria acervulina]
MLIEQRTEPGRQDWSSYRPSKSFALHHRAANGLSRASATAVFVDPNEESRVALAITESRMPSSLNSVEERVDAHSTMRVPPFLQPVVNAHYTSCGRQSPASASEKVGKAAPKEQAATSKNGRLPSAPSTASTTTAETTTKVTVAPSREPLHGNMRAAATLLACKETQVNPAQGDAGTISGKTFQEEPSPASALNPHKSTHLSVPAAFEGCSVPDKQCSAMKQRTHSNEDTLAKKGTLQSIRDIRATAEEGSEGTKCKGMQYDQSVARLVAALGASSLRLAAAAEEGLDSSSSDDRSRTWQHSERSPIRTSVNAETDPLRTVSPSTPATNSLAFTQTRSSPFTRRVPSTPKAAAKSRRKLSPFVDVSRNRRSQESAQQTPSQRSLTKERLRAGRRSDTINQKQIVNHHHKFEAILLDLRANAQTASMASQESEALPCRNTCSPPAVGSTRSSNSDSKTSITEVRTTFSKEAAVFPTGTPDGLPWDSLHRSAEWPLLAHGPHRSEILRQDCVSNADHGEEERQFSLLLQHSLGLLRREAARCFASTQASVKQKLWRELQHERHLRLQLQQEHQVGYAAAEAELVSLRAQQVEDHERMEKILGLCCRRKYADEGSQLLRFAWKGWQIQRVLSGRLKKLQKALQQRYLFMLQLRTFLPWRAAAARRTLEQKMQRTQMLFQQEVQRLGQAHLKNTQKQQQELQQLQQQLHCEMHLRECLQQSLIGLVTGGGVTAASQGASFSSPRGTISFAPAAALRIQKQERQQRPKDPENHTRRQRLLRVVGTQSHLRSRQQPTSQNTSRQQQDEQLHRFHYPPKQPWCHWISQNAGLGVPILNALYKVDPRAANGVAADAARRVKFMDDQAQQEQQTQRKFLLSNLLPDSLPQGQNYTGESAGVSSSSQACRHHHCSSSGLASSSVPNFGCWELIPDNSFKKNAAAVRRHSSEDDSFLQQVCSQPNGSLGEKRNYSGSASWNPAPVGSFGLEFHSHKQTRWTSARQSNPEV